MSDLCPRHDEKLHIADNQSAKVALSEMMLVRAIFVTQECAAKVSLNGHCFPKYTV
ncbi:hypothetical protein [Yersinia kristensenii]|uniref:hypothetical protein n=1 Tax=Yersinia kristensenii TaxID=28152 RepID=UPI001C100093|nr:hypothetical protein [Yersinia kristensenii]